MPVAYNHKTDTILYNPLDEDILKQKANSLIDQFVKYVTAKKLDLKHVSIQRIVLPRIFIHVDQDEGCFMIFHDQTRINEIKQAALIVYWILKFKPFSIVTDDPDILNDYRRINECFAAFYLLSAFVQYAKLKGFSLERISQNLVEELLYAFTYWDLSKEAIILIAESLAEAFFIH